MSRSFRCSPFIFVMAVLLLAVTAASADTLVEVTSQSGLSPDSSISWLQLGGDQTLVPASVGVTSNHGLSATVTLAGANSVVSVVCAQAPPLSTNCSWNGAGFTAGDSLLWSVNAYTGGNGPMTLTFASGIIGAGALIQSDVPGQFTASIQAFNGGTSLGTFTETSNAAGDALYLGVKDSSGANVTSVVYSLTACAASCADFALDGVDLATSAASSSTTTVVSSAPNPSVFGQSVTLTATVSSSGGTPTGTVQFQIDGSNFGSPVALSGGVATSSSTSALTVGAHSTAAIYSGSTNFLASTGTGSQVVSKASTSTSLISSVNPSLPGEAVTFTATISVLLPGSGTPTGTVTFYDGPSPISTQPVSSGQAAFTTSTLVAGSHFISAIYSGDSNFNTSSSSSVHQVVEPGELTVSPTSIAFGNVKLDNTAKK